MLGNPVEGVHYIFDRYAFLNDAMADGGHNTRIGPDSPAEDIKTAIKLARAMYHPDRQSRSGDSMRQKAEAMSLLVDDCEKFLTDPDIRPLYDEKLAQFKQNRPDLVSENGTAIIDLTGENLFDLDALISDDIPDTTAFEERVSALVQYDESRTDQARALYESMPDVPQIRAIYRDALTQKLTYLSLMEDAAWAKIGYLNRKNKTAGHVINADEYADKVDDALKNAVHQDIESATLTRGNAARIGLARMPLLLSFNGAAAQGTPDAKALSDPALMHEILAQVKKKALENLEIRADYVRDIARRKQDCLVALTELTPVTPLNTINPDDPVYDFYLANPGEDVAKGFVGLQREILASRLGKFPADIQRPAGIIQSALDPVRERRREDRRELRADNKPGIQRPEIRHAHRRIADQKPVPVMVCGGKCLRRIHRQGKLADLVGTRHESFRRVGGTYVHIGLHILRQKRGDARVGQPQRILEPGLRQCVVNCLFDKETQRDRRHTIPFTADIFKGHVADDFIGTILIAEKIKFSGLALCLIFDLDHVLQGIFDCRIFAQYGVAHCAVRTVGGDKNSPGGITRRDVFWRSDFLDSRFNAQRPCIVFQCRFEVVCPDKDRTRSRSHEHLRQRPPGDVPEESSFGGVAFILAVEQRG